MSTEELRWAAAEIRECQRVLDKSGLNLVGEVLRGFGAFTEFEHYPPDDVYDSQSHAQYYFHAHPPGGRAWSDYGHFHIFLRPRGMPAGLTPALVADPVFDLGDNDALSHLIALSMTRDGLPERLFTTNRWVTAETWYDAPAVKAMLPYGVFDLAWPSWPLNRWLTAMLVLYRAEIETLLEHRDQAVADWLKTHPGGNVFEDRSLEITSEMMISLEDKLAEVDRLAP